jgi:hypothetical protein
MAGRAGITQSRSELAEHLQRIRMRPQRLRSEALTAACQDARLCAAAVLCTAVGWAYRRFPWRNRVTALSMRL